MSRLTILLLVLLAMPLAVAMPYAVNRVINLYFGPSAADLHHKDGSVSHMGLDPRMKPPPWLHFPPGTIVADAGTTSFYDKPDQYGSFDFTVPMTLPDAKRYFQQSLTAEGFVMTDLGLGTLTQKEAEYLGESGTMTGTRAATGETVTIAFREEEGLFRKSWQIQLGWHRVPTPAAKPPEKPIRPEASPVSETEPASHSTGSGTSNR